MQSHTVCINEPEVCSLIMKSTLKLAAKFQDWVFGEVFHQLESLANIKLKENILIL